jgi:outer membrane lipoprotein LolB
LTGRVSRRIALLTTAAWLVACASVAPTRDTQRLHQGRFSSTFILDGRTENNTGRFTLAVHADGLTLELASPLGNTMARIETDPRGARMSYSNPGGGTQTAQGASAEALANEVLGWRVPVSGMRDWILGRPDPARPSRALPDGDFEQTGWIIRVLERFGPGGAPRLLTFERSATPDSPAVTLRLALEESNG